MVGYGWCALVKMREKSVALTYTRTRCLSFSSAPLSAESSGARQQRPQGRASAKMAHAVEMAASMSEEPIAAVEEEELDDAALFGTLVLDIIAR